jgi:hypothetical protein
MVSFRFHLVSLVAVFLALALGIGMGATVIDKATVDSLKRRVATVEDERDNANQQVTDLNRSAARSAEWEAIAQTHLVANTLRDVPVTFVAIRGTDQGPLNEQRKILELAGASVQGTLWITSKARLDDSAAVSSMQRDLGAQINDVAQLRQAFLARISAVLAGASSPESLRPLQSDGFIDWEGAAIASLIDADLDASRLLIASGSKPDAPNEQVAVPLTRLLAVQPSKRVVAVEAGREADARSNTSGERAVYLDVVRRDGSLDGRLSTVDDIELAQGRTAVVLALAQLPSGRTGDYGLADSAEGPLPELNR